MALSPAAEGARGKAGDAFRQDASRRPQRGLGMGTAWRWEGRDRMGDGAYEVRFDQPNRTEMAGGDAR